MARILLGVSGGVAAYKALEVVRLATAAGHAVRVIQTPTSRRFVGMASFEALTGAPVLVSEFDRDPARGAFPDEPAPAHDPIGHLELARKADVLLIAPASANTLAKLACGLADNLLSSCALAARCPLVLAPAMNNHMYEHAATQANVATLRARGATVIEPEEGRLASRGEHGRGRLPEPAELLRACEGLLGQAHGSSERPPSPLKDACVLVTAGGTREPIDSVRFVGNSSSGRMGMALASAAQARGANVIVIAANVAVEPPAGAKVRRVRTAAELAAACDEEFPACDVLLMAAAVADFRPARPTQEKIKKQGRDGLTIELEPTADVLRELAGRRRAEQTLVAFAAEHGADAVELARAKLDGKGVDAVIVNDISRGDIGFESHDNEVTILTHSSCESVARASKERIASAILDAVERLHSGG